MNAKAARHDLSALTRLDLLIVIAVALILLGLLWPSSSGRDPMYLSYCINNQKGILISELLWQQDHHGMALWQLAINNTSTSSNAAVTHFEALSDYLSNPRVLVCRSDRARKPASSQNGFVQSNLSYFVNLSAITNRPDTVLIGDRHLAIRDNAVSSGIFSLTTNLEIKWTRELHWNSPKPTGVLGFSDGHVEIVKSESLSTILRRQNLTTNLLAIP